MSSAPAGYGRDIRNTSAYPQGQYTQNACYSKTEIGARTGLSKKMGMGESIVKPYGDEPALNKMDVKQGELCFERSGTASYASVGIRLPKSIYNNTNYDDGAPVVISSLCGVGFMCKGNVFGINSQAEFEALEDEEQRAIIRSQWTFRGVAKTPIDLTPGFLQDKNKRLDFPLTIGGIETLINSDNEEVLAGDLVVWDVPSVKKGPNGLPLAKPYPPSGRLGIDGTHPDKKLFCTRKLKYDEILNQGRISGILQNIIRHLGESYVTAAAPVGNDMPTWRKWGLIPSTVHGNPPRRMHNPEPHREYARSLINFTAMILRVDNANGHNIQAGNAQAKRNATAGALDAAAPDESLYAKKALAILDFLFVMDNRPIEAEIKEIRMSRNLAVKDLFSATGGVIQEVSRRIIGRAIRSAAPAVQFDCFIGGPLIC